MTDLRRGDLLLYLALGVPLRIVAAEGDVADADFARTADHHCVGPLALPPGVPHYHVPLARAAFETSRGRCMVVWPKALPAPDPRWVEAVVASTEIAQPTSALARAN